MDDPSNRRLLLFGKLPTPGAAKTRLAPLLGAAGAAHLYRAFLEDAVETAGRVGGARVELWLEPPVGAGHRPAPEVASRARRGHPGIPIRWQRGGGLGARLENAFSRAFGGGAQRVLIAGTDHPTLPAAYLEEGLRVLERCDLALGPTRDGGYYAVGLRREAWPRAGKLFHGIPWSTDRVYRRTRGRAASLGLRVAVLGEWYDVDEPAHLELLRRDLRPGSHTAAALAAVADAGWGTARGDAPGGEGGRSGERSPGGVREGGRR